jgi:hypothetical protein
LIVCVAIPAWYGHTVTLVNPGPIALKWARWSSRMPRGDVGADQAERLIHRDRHAEPLYGRACASENWGLLVANLSAPATRNHPPPPNSRCETGSQVTE